MRTCSHSSPRAVLSSATLTPYTADSGTALRKCAIFQGGASMVARSLRTIAAAVFALGAWTGTAHAQVTGTVTGTVKDPQGGVIPGATVTLTSESRGTKLPDAVTNESGNFQF